METIGPRSTKLLKEIEELEVTRDKAAEEEAGLSRDVTDRKKKLNLARAQGLVGKMDRDRVAAFESELEALRGQLAEKRSTLAGLDAMLAQKVEALKGAQLADAEESLATEEMAAVQKGLERNGKALEKTRAAFLKVLEAGAARLLEETAADRERWAQLIEERRELYRRRRRALGTNATMSDESFRKMEKDPLARRPFGDPGDISQAVALAEVLRPLSSE